MNKKRLLKSIIGTVAIYGVLVALLFIFSNIVDLLVYMWIYEGVLIACSIAAGLLFKGELYAAVWSAGTIIFFVAVFWAPSGWDLESFLMAALMVLAPLLIPFFIVKSIFVSIKLQEQEKS